MTADKILAELRLWHVAENHLVVIRANLADRTLTPNDVERLTAEAAEHEAAQAQVIDVLSR